MAYITVRDLTLGYDSHSIVEGLNFNVNAGEYLCIVGENGSGKTTLMKTLLHLQEPVRKNYRRCGKMKKKLCRLICMVLISFLTIGAACGCSSKRPGQNQPAGVNDVLEQGMADTDSEKADSMSKPVERSKQNQQNTESQETKTPESSSEPDSTSTPFDSADGVDVDLTVLSSTMVYSEVYNMMASPEKYIGKTVRMKGLFAYFRDKVTDNYYFACIIQDATACCAQGIEFVLTDDYVYPDDYPEMNEEICVVGVFDTYQEGDYTYCALRDAILQ